MQLRKQTHNKKGFFALRAGRAPIPWALAIFVKLPLLLLTLALLVGCDQETQHIRASKLLFSSNDPVKQKQGFEFLLNEYENGSAYSAGKIGWAYQKGLGVEKDLVKAVELYEYAASRGMTYWQFMLAHAYEMGYLGLDKNEERRDYWLNFKDKRHIDTYECWVKYYYSNGFYPSNTQLESMYEEACKNS